MGKLHSILGIMYAPQQQYQQPPPYQQAPTPAPMGPSPMVPPGQPEEPKPKKKKRGKHLVIVGVLLLIIGLLITILGYSISHPVDAKSMKEVADDFDSYDDGDKITVKGKITDEDEVMGGRYTYQLDNEEIHIWTSEDVGDLGDEIYFLVEVDKNDEDLKAIGIYQIPGMFWIGIILLIVGVLLLVMGIIKIRKTRKAEAERFECPECFAIVTLNEVQCPSCGMVFVDNVNAVEGEKENILERKMKLLGELKRLREDHKKGKLKDDVFKDLEAQYKKQIIGIMKKMDEDDTMDQPDPKHLPQQVDLSIQKPQQPNGSNQSTQE